MGAALIVEVHGEFIFFVFFPFEMEFHPCWLGWSAMA